jgi:hypothetical protein
MQLEMTSRRRLTEEIEIKLEKQSNSMIVSQKLDCFSTLRCRRNEDEEKRTRRTVHKKESDTERERNQNRTHKKEIYTVDAALYNHHRVASAPTPFLTAIRFRSLTNSLSIFHFEEKLNIVCAIDRIDLEPMS